MKRTVGRLSVGVALICAALGLTPQLVLGAELQIGTGSRVGVYFQVGRAICRSLERAEPGFSCESLSTPGSLANLRALRSGALRVAVAQSDWHFHALRGGRNFEAAGPDPSLRSLFSVHSEPFTVVARREAGISRFQQLKGRRVNIGNPGSGQRGTMEVLMQALGWTKDDFLLANELPADQQSLALCHDRIDAMVYTVGHPNASVAKAAGLCDAVLVTVDGPEVDRLVAENPFYAYAEVPSGVYPGMDEPVRSFGVKATVVASTGLDEDTAYRLVRAVFERLDEFRDLHPAFGALTPERMISDGLSAPLHPGALRYYREKGWITN